MQRLIFQQTGVTQFQSQASRVLPGHGAGGQDQAINDDIYHDEDSRLWLVISVLGNVIGGVLILSGMFLLPHLMAEILS